MKKSIKAAGIAVAISSLAMLVSAISMFIGGFAGINITVFCCMTAVFCSNVAIYAAEKKKYDNSKE